MPYDANLVLRDGSTNLKATETTSALDIKGTPLKGLACRVTVPQASGTSPTLDVKVQDSDDGTNWDDLVVFPQITQAGTYRRQVATPRRYVRAVLTVGGTSPNFGGVRVELGLPDAFRVSG